MVQGVLDPLLETLYTAAMEMDLLLFLSVVCSVYFTDLPSSPLTQLSFSGTAIRVFGSGKTNWAADYPTWNCSLDGNLFTTSAGPISVTNNWALCDSQFSDGTHIFTFSVNVQNEATTWFDHIQYIPSAKDSLDNSTALVDSSDTSVIHYSPGWSWYNQPTSIMQNFGSTHYVHSTGSYFTFWFIGS